MNLVRKMRERALRTHGGEALKDCIAKILTDAKAAITTNTRKISVTTATKAPNSAASSRSQAAD